MVWLTPKKRLRSDFVFKEEAPSSDDYCCGFESVEEARASPDQTVCPGCCRRTTWKNAQWDDNMGEITSYCNECNDSPQKKANALIANRSLPEILVQDFDVLVRIVDFISNW